MNSEAVQVLLLEDNPADARLQIDMLAEHRRRETIRVRVATRLGDVAR